MIKQLEETIDFLKSQEKGIVLSHESNGQLIKFFSENNILIDENIDYGLDGNERFLDAQEIFNSRNLKKTIRVIEKNNIDYFFIDDDMKEGLVWDAMQIRNCHLITYNPWLFSTPLL